MIKALTKFRCDSSVREGGEGRGEMVVRVQARDQTWVWLYMVLQLQSGDVPVASSNYVIRYATPAPPPPRTICKNATCPHQSS